MSSSERTKELTIDSTLWTDPKRIINLHDFDPKNYIFIQNLIVLVIHQMQALKIL